MQCSAVVTACVRVEERKGRPAGSVGWRVRYPQMISWTGFGEELVEDGRLIWTSDWMGINRML